MPKSSTTIYDVASAAGVSISTVSRVLNNPEKVNEETRSAVMEAIDRLGFVPRADARARALRDNRRIGVITPFFTAPSFVQRLRGVASALQSSNFELIIFTVDTAEKLNSHLEMLPLTGNLDGLIVLSLQINDHYAMRLASHNLETVLIEYPHNSLSSVEIDDEKGGQMAAEYLCSKGHRRIGFAGDTTIPEFGLHPIARRLSGLRSGLAKQGLKIGDKDLLQIPYDVEATRRIATEYLRQPDRPSAFFAATDLQGIGILKAARALGLRIPQDLAILGFDDLDAAEYVGLTTIRQHLDESGRVAVELLLSRLADPQRSVQHIRLPLSIVERDTV